MAAPDNPADATAGLIPEGLAEAGTYATVEAGFDHGLVVLAMGRSYCLVRSGAGFRLLVDSGALESVREQLACFDRESIGWPPRPPGDAATPSRTFELRTPVVWATVVLAAFVGQRLWPGRWETAGALDTVAVFDGGEGWRIGTALFLHADLGHLLSNVISGVFVFAAVIATIGRRRGWLLLALSSLAGNLATAALNYPGPYRSLGASTAVFAGLGLLTGRAVRVLRQPGGVHPWRSVFTPLAAGATLLGLFGAGGLRTDVAAHLTGFASGLVLGFLATGQPRPGGIDLPAPGAQVD